MRVRLWAIGLLALAAIAASPQSASAQATRTWVSGVGDDVNPCSRTAPCKTFAGAITKTAAGGEINCLDPGGYGAVTITKSMTISCPYTEGGALAGGNGITVNTGPGDSVFLRGLDIFGVNPPSNGVRFIGAGALHIEDSVIRRFNGENSYGVSIAPTGEARVIISRSIIADNGNDASGGGISVQPSGNGSATVFVLDSTISNNGGTGLVATGATASAHVSESRIVGNHTGIAAASGGKISSYGDNIVAENLTDGSFQATGARE